MLGTIRFMLASLVVMNHFWLPVANKVGAHAVVAFYLISGFLMTRVLTEVYTRPVAGTALFLLNRAMRIYPPFLFFVLLTLCGLWLMPASFEAVYSLVRVPQTASQWLANVTLWNLTQSPVSLIPPAWSLSVEVFFYIAMSLVLARYQIVVLVWFLAALCYTIYINIEGYGFAQRYYPVDAAALFFSVGALLYFIHARGTRWRIPTLLGVGITAVYLPFPLVVEALGGDRLSAGFYGAALLFIPLFAWVFELRLPRWQQVDGFLGDLAYPVFLSHFFAAGVVIATFSHIVSWGSTVFFALTYGTTIVLSVLFLLGPERQVERMRDRIRRAARPLP